MKAPLPEAAAGEENHGPLCARHRGDELIARQTGREVEPPRCRRRRLKSLVHEAQPGLAEVRLPHGPSPGGDGLDPAPLRHQAVQIRDRLLGILPVGFEIRGALHEEGDVDGSSRGCSPARGPAHATRGAVLRHDEVVDAEPHDRRAEPVLHRDVRVDLGELHRVHPVHAHDQPGVQGGRRRRAARSCSGRNPRRARRRWR